VPLAAWIVAGALFHGDLLWFVRWGAENLVRSRSSLPVLDGILGSLLSGSPQRMVKGGLALAVLLLAATTLVLSVRRRFAFGILFSLPVAAMAVLINQYEIWAVIRFSRVLVLPLAYFMPAPELTGPLAGRVGWVSLALVAFFLTNVAFGYYMARVFFS
jgi:hypothetical protein